MGAFGQFFQPADYVLAVPFIMLTLFAVSILLIDLFLTPELKWLNAVLALLGTAFTAFAVMKMQQSFAQAGTFYGRAGFTNLLIVDRLSIYFFYLFLAGTAVAILMSVKYLDVERENHGEYYALMLFSVVGMMCMAAGFDIVLIFIGLELMAISTYVLVGFLRRDRRSNEAALKYFLLGAFSSGIFAYGLSLFYGVSGSTNLLEIARNIAPRIAAAHGKADPILIVALLTTAVGVLFKIAAIPFHQWAPDAYEGAPSSITGFMSVAVKAAGWAMLLRIALIMWAPLRPVYVPLLVFVSLATMTGANLAALTQNNLKRLLAYSSIAHVGYMLLGLVAGTSTMLNPDGVKGILIYLLVYTFMNLGAFAVITSLASRKLAGDEIDDIAGLYFRRPFEAILMLIFLLSLAGIPPLAGFWGKYFIFLSLVSTGHYALAATAVLYTVFGLYYYLRIANAMFVRKPVEDIPLQVSLGMRIALGISAIATVAIGLYPNPFIELVNWSLGLTNVHPMASLLH